MGSTKDQIIEAIKRLFADQTVSQSQTLEDLEEIGSLVDGYIDVLREELDSDD